MVDIVIDQTWTWVCYTCRDITDPAVPGAYGVGDNYAEVAAEVAAHKRKVHHEPQLRAVL